MKWHFDHPILHIELNCEPCNEIGMSMLSFFEDFLQQAPLENAKALIISSSNAKGFSAGADLRSLYEGLTYEPKKSHKEKIENFIDRIHHVLDTLDLLPIPVIAVTHGICFGGGFELALVADIIIAEETTRFCFPELRLGLIPGFGGIPRLMREVSNQTIRDFLLTGRSIQAKNLPSLVSQVVPSGKGLGIAKKMALQMSKFDTNVVQIAKKFIKPEIKEKLHEEKALFIKMVLDPKVQKALESFVQDTSQQPYLPK